MLVPGKPANEAARIDALHGLNLDSALKSASIA